MPFNIHVKNYFKIKKLFLLKEYTAQKLSKEFSSKCFSQEKSLEVAQRTSTQCILSAKTTFYF